MRNRFACTDDLLNYFKKKDLLGGLTTSEQAQLRKNIGIIDYNGEGEQSHPIELTYAQFWDLYRSNSLVTGACYAITDFQTIYTSNVYNSGGQLVTWGGNVNPSQTWKIYLRAIAGNQIDNRVIIDGKDWEVRYDPTRKLLEDGTPTKGQIIFLADNNGNRAFYDFKNIKWRWSREKLTEAGISTIKDLDLYTFSEITGTEVSDSSELHNTKFNTIEEGCYDNIFIGDTYYNTIQPECYHNIFAKGCHDSTIKWNSTNNRFNEPVTYLTGTINNKQFETGDNVLSTAITKTIHKVNEATIVSFLDPITYSHQVVLV